MVVMFTSCEKVEEDNSLIEDYFRLLLGDLSYSMEPKDKGDFDVEFTGCQVVNFGDLFGTESDYLELMLINTDDFWCADFGLFIPLASGEDIYGTYTVKRGKYDNWVVMPSLGSNEEGDSTPSYVGTGTTEDGNMAEAYYVESGKVTITEDGVAFDIKTLYGSRIKGEYKGDIYIDYGGIYY